jgi:hypothetical protein
MFHREGSKEFGDDMVNLCLCFTWNNALRRESPKAGVHLANLAGMPDPVKSRRDAI